MLHKMMIGLIAVAAIAVMAMPTDVSARGGRGGHGGHFSGGHFSHFRGGFGYRPYVYSYGYSCWRWFGPRRVWVCGGYPYY
jgi:hypothetical protein